MDFLKLNNEFQNLQKKLEESEKYRKNINDYIKRIDKEIMKLEKSNETEKDNIEKMINNLILEIKKDVKMTLQEIIKVEDK